jgi:hypothetical protein
MFKKIPYRITGIELGEHAHHNNIPDKSLQTTDSVSNAMAYGWAN